MSGTDAGCAHIGAANERAASAQAAVEAKRDIKIV
jgi:hypothetical protein